MGLGMLHVPWVAVPVLTAWATSLAMGAALAIGYREPLLGGLCHSLGQVGLLAIYVRGVIRLSRRRSVSWRGTTYRLDEIRRGQRL